MNTAAAVAPAVIVAAAIVPAVQTSEASVVPAVIAAAAALLETAEVIEFKVNALSGSIKGTDPQDVLLHFYYLKTFTWVPYGQPDSFTNFFVFNDYADTNFWVVTPCPRN